MSLHEQFLTMSFMLASGLALGVLYDVFRVAIRRPAISRHIMPMLDLAYWVLATILVFRLLYLGNFGQVRVFVFLAILIGISLYFALLSIWILKTLYLFIRIVKTIYRVTIRTGNIVIVKPVIGLYRLVMIIIGLLLAITIFLYKIMLQLLYPFWFILRPLVRWLIKLVKKGDPFDDGKSP